MRGWYIYIYTHIYIYIYIYLFHIFLIFLNMSEIFVPQLLKLPAAFFHDVQSHGPLRMLRDIGKWSEVRTSSRWRLGKSWLDGPRDAEVKKNAFEMENHRTIMGKYGDIPEDGCFSGKHIYKCGFSTAFPLPHLITGLWFVHCFFVCLLFVWFYFIYLSPSGASLICLYSQNKS